MRLFSEKVNPTLTNSSLNIISVEDFEEIFFGVYEIEINKTKYPVEKISEHNGNPVVSVPVVIGGKKSFYPFVLTKGNQEILFNENNTMYTPVVIQPINEVPLTPIFEKSEPIVPIIDNKKEILEQIEKAKLNAKKEVQKLKLQKQRELQEQSEKKQKLLEKTLQNARLEMVEEFVNISQKIKGEIVNVNDERFSEIQITIDNKINDIAESLKYSLTENFENATSTFDSKIKELVKEMYSSINPKIDNELKNIATEIVEKVDSIEKNLDSKLSDKADKILLEGLNREIDAIRDVNIELNDKINKGVNKSLSRVGNIDKKVDDITVALAEDVESKIQKAEENITKYYEEKLQMLEEKTFDITEETRKYFVELVQDSRNNLIEEIRKIKNEKPIEYIVESKGKTQKINSDDLLKDVDKKITSKVDTEVTRLRKYIAVYSGGGSVAQQFADGGTMNGNLTVVGAISASQYLGIPYPSENDDLDTVTSRGNITNNDISVGGLSASSVDISGGTITGTNLNTTKANLTGGNTFTGNQTFSTNTLFVDSVNNRVGIGTVTPGYKFHVTDATSSTITTQSGTRRVMINSYAGDWNYNTSFGAPYIIGTQDNNHFLLYSNNTERVRITNGGNVGIGTSTPSEKLEVYQPLALTNSLIKVGTSSDNITMGVAYSGGAAYPSFWYNATPSPSNYFFQAGATRTFFNAPATGGSYLGFRIGNVDKLRILENGSVGIGTSTPSEKLTVVGNISASGTVTGTNLVYNSSDQTVAGVKTFSSNIVGNGTDNTLPNQTITSASNILTRGLGDLRYSPSFETPITTDTISPITEQFEDFVNSYGDLYIANAYGSPNLVPSPVFGDNWTGSNIVGGVFSGNDEYTQHGIVLVRGPSVSNTCSYMQLIKPCRLDSNSEDSSELTIRMFLNISGFESETYFGIGIVPFGGTGSGDTACLGGLIFNPYINPNYLILAASSTGGTSPYLFKTAPATYAYQTTSRPVSALVKKWWNLKYSLDRINMNITVSAIRDGVTVYTNTFALNSTNFGDRYYYLYGVGASRQIGFTFGRFNYATNRTQVYFDYWRYRTFSTKTFPINWNSLRF